MVHLDDLALFLAIVETGSISGAARHRHMTRSTATRRLAALEDTLGVQLVTRTTQALSITHAGEVFAEHAQKICGAMREAESAVHHLDARPRGHLRIATPIISTHFILAPMLAAFAEAYPEITLEAVLDGDASDLVGNSFDVGLQLGLEHNSSLTLRKLVSTRMCLVASASYLRQHGTPTSLEALREHRLLALRRPGGEIEPWPLRGGGNHRVCAPHYVCNSVELHQEGIKMGLGIGLVTPVLLREELDSGALVEVLPDEINAVETFSLVYSSTRIIPPRVRVFVDFVVAWADEFLALSDEPL